MDLKKTRQVFAIAGLSFGLLAACSKTTTTSAHKPKSVNGAQEASVHNPALNIPLVMNDRVQVWLDYFQGRGRPHFERYLRRSGKYIPMMKKILREQGMPEDLVYLAMIESGFNTQAYSHAKATGAWQFISQTGVRYGLNADQWHDERRNPEKSTLAAAKYLRDLYARYQDWYLAAAGYNAGEGKIDRAIRKYSTEDFWELTQGKYLKPETKDYVPKLIAATMIAKNPKKYGFHDIEYEEPVDFVVVTLEKPIDLRVAAKCAGITYDEMKTLNPELTRWVTPLTHSSYELKVPASSKDKFEDEYSLLEPRQLLGEDRLTVQKAQTLERVARKQGISPILLAAANDLNTYDTVKPGTELIIPFTPPAGESLRDPADKKGKNRKGRETGRRVATRRGKNVYREVGSISGSTKRSSRLAMAESGDSKKHPSHRVRKGESIDSIAKKYKVSPSRLREVNKISNSRKLKKGQTLKIPSKQTASLN